MEAFIRSGHLKWHINENALNKEFYKFIKSKVTSLPMFGLKDNQGEIHTSLHEMHKMAETYYQGLFTIEPWIKKRKMVINKVLQSVPQKVDDSSAKALCRTFTLKELEEAVRDLNDDKMFGEDGNGMPQVHYKTNWEWLGPKVLNTWNEVMRMGKWPLGAIDRIIALIPKKGGMHLESRTGDRSRC